MGKRLTRIYTRTGDDGTTGLGDGTRTTKNSLRVEAIGTVDELNSCLGVLLAEILQQNEVRAELEDIQHELFDFGADLSVPGRLSMNVAQIDRLEQQLDAHNKGLPSLKEFILPGGVKAASLCHVARTVCRRAERSVLALYHAEGGAPQHLQYLNRLSDYLFVLCRILNQQQGMTDVTWRPGKTSSGQ